MKTIGKDMIKINSTAAMLNQATASAPVLFSRWKNGLKGREKNNTKQKKKLANVLFCLVLFLLYIYVSTAIWSFFLSLVYSLSLSLSPALSFYLLSRCRGVRRRGVEKLLYVALVNLGLRLAAVIAGLTSPLPSCLAG